MTLLIICSFLTFIFISIAMNDFYIGSMEVKNLIFFLGRDNNANGIFNIIIGNRNNVHGSFNIVIGNDIELEESFRIIRK